MVKRKRQRLILYTCLAAAIAAVVYYVTRPAEPQYAGKPLSYWVDRTWSSSDPDPHGEALKAVRDMGTNAVPHLIRMLGGPKSEASRKYERLVLKLPGKLSEKLYFLHSRDQRAAVALGMIGPEAAPAVPALIAKLGDFGFGSAVIHPYVEALVQIGTPAVPQIGMALSHPDSQVRKNALETLQLLGANAVDAVPDLIRLVERNGDEMERLYALLLLQGFSHRSELVISFFIRRLDDRSMEARAFAIQALGESGDKAKAAIPKLRQMLVMENVEVRPAVFEALKKIEPRTSP